MFATCSGLCGLAICSGLCRLATCFGASTVMLGSGAAEPVAVCDTAVPLRPHSNAVDRIATAEGATGLDDNLMTMSSQIQDGHAVPMRTRYHTYSTGQNFRVWKLSKRYLSMTRRRLTAAVALSASGTFPTWRSCLMMSADRGEAEIICSFRVFPFDPERTFELAVFRFTGAGNRYRSLCSGIKNCGFPKTAI